MGYRKNAEAQEAQEAAAGFIEVGALELGDIIRLPGGLAFSDAVVKRIDRINNINHVTVERPYMSSENFATDNQGTRTVICCIGHEDVRMSNGVVILKQKKGPLK